MAESPLMNIEFAGFSNVCQFDGWNWVGSGIRVDNNVNFGTKNSDFRGNINISTNSLNKLINYNSWVSLALPHDM
jgi:hypothetical protein